MKPKILLGDEFIVFIYLCLLLSFPKMLICPLVDDDSTLQVGLMIERLLVGLYAINGYCSLPRALQAGCKKPLLVRPIDESFQFAGSVATLGALHALYVVSTLS